MEITDYWAPFNSGGKSTDSFFCYPSKIGEKKPAILLIQEIWGVDEHIQDLARRYAEAGYFVAAPDLYSRGGKPPARSAGRINELKDFLDRAPMSVIMNPEQRSEFIRKEEPDRAIRLTETMESIFNGRDMSGMAEILSDAASMLKSKIGASSVGTVGYCMGGALSFAMAADSSVDASVVYYGNAPDPDALGKLRSPVLGLYGGEDHRISDAVPDVAAKLKAAGKSYEYRIYEGAQHAFFNDTRASYSYRASRDAWGRTLEFFRKNLM